MVPLDGLPFEKEGDNYREDGERNHLLDHLQLHQVERSAVALEADPVGRDGKAVLEESDAPGKQDDQDKRPARGDFHFLQLEMAVPGERHEDVREDKHYDGPDALHVNLFLGRKINIFLRNTQKIARSRARFIRKYSRFLTNGHFYL